MVHKLASNVNTCSRNKLYWYFQQEDAWVPDIGLPNPHNRRSAEGGFHNILDKEKSGSGYMDIGCYISSEVSKTATNCSDRPGVLQSDAQRWEIACPSACLHCKCKPQLADLSVHQNSNWISSPCSATATIPNPKDSISRKAKFSSFKKCNNSYMTHQLLATGLSVRTPTTAEGKREVLCPDEFHTGSIYIGPNHAKEHESPHCGLWCSLEKPLQKQKETKTLLKWCRGDAQRISFAPVDHNPKGSIELFDVKMQRSGRDSRVASHIENPININPDFPSGLLNTGEFQPLCSRINAVSHCSSHLTASQFQTPTTYPLSGKSLQFQRKIALENVASYGEKRSTCTVVSTAEDWQDTGEQRRETASLVETQPSINRDSMQFYFYKSQDPASAASKRDVPVGPQSTGANSRMCPVSCQNIPKQSLGWCPKRERTEHGKETELIPSGFPPSKPKNTATSLLKAISILGTGGGISILKENALSGLTNLNKPDKSCESEALEGKDTGSTSFSGDKLFKKISHSSNIFLCLDALLRLLKNACAMSAFGSSSDLQQLRDTTVSPFHCASVPNMSLDVYINRIFRHTHMTMNDLVVALALLCRFLCAQNRRLLKAVEHQKDNLGSYTNEHKQTAATIPAESPALFEVKRTNPELDLRCMGEVASSVEFIEWNFLTAHRLFLGACALTDKIQHDHHRSPREWAKVKPTTMRLALRN